PHSEPETIDPFVHENVTDPLQHYFAAGHFICTQVSTTKATANAGDAGLGRCPEIRESNTRPEQARSIGEDRDRLVRSVARRQICSDVDFERRERRWNVAHL